MTKENGGVKPTRKALYAKTHTRKDGKYSSDTVAKVIVCVMFVLNFINVLVLIIFLLEFILVS